jgi:hypothetical protein
MHCAVRHCVQLVNARAAPDPQCSCASCRLLKEAERKTPGFQRLRMAQYDDLRKKLISSHGTRALKGEVRLHVHVHACSLHDSSPDLIYPNTVGWLYPFARWYVLAWWTHSFAGVFDCRSVMRP